MLSIINYLVTNWIEFLGTILSVIYLYLSIKQRIGLWVFGFLCSLLYVIVFFQAKFYADMSLQFYYLAVSVYGWFSWKGKSENSEPTLAISKTNLKSGIVLLFIAVAIYFLYFYVLSKFTDSPLPRADSFTTALSIVATWMLARKKLEHWLLWIIVDSVSAGLYIYKGLYITSILFGIYTIMAVVGYYQWRKSYLKLVTSKRVDRSKISY